MVSLVGADAAKGIYGVYHTASWDDNVPGIAKATEYCKKNHPEDYGNMDYLGTWSACLTIREILTLAVKNVGYTALAKAMPLPGRQWKIRVSRSLMASSWTVSREAPLPIHPVTTGSTTRETVPGRER